MVRLHPHQRQDDDGVYDIHVYGGLSYSNLVPGDAPFSTVHNDPLWNAQVKSVIASQGYVNDYYSGDNNCGSTFAGVYGDDVASLHAANCLADYMGSGQDWAAPAEKTNPDGSTWIYYLPSGDKYYAKNAVADNLMVLRNGVYESKDGMLGMDLYFRSRGYGTGNIADDMNFYTQLIYSTSAPLGCTFAQYKKMIDDGLVVMIQVAGHSLFGYGYTDDGKIIFDDTWGDYDLTMDWGGSYDGRTQWGITVFDPTGGSPVPLPSTFLLMVSGLGGLAGWRVRFRQK